MSSVLFGMFAKETAIAFLFAAFFLFRMFDGRPSSVNWNADKLPWRSIIVVTGAFYVAAAFVALFTYNYGVVLLLVAGYGIFIQFKFIRDRKSVV